MKRRQDYEEDEKNLCSVINTGHGTRNEYSNICSMELYSKQLQLQIATNDNNRSIYRLLNLTMVQTVNGNIELVGTHYTMVMVYIGLIMIVEPVCNCRS